MPRIHEIDLLRGIGIVLMIFYHTAYDLDFFGVREIPLERFHWVLIARIVQVIFIITTGITFMLSFNLRRRLKQAGVLFVLAMVITLVTWLLFGEKAVKFGILHFFAFAILVTIPLRQFGMWNSLIGLLVLILGFFIDRSAGSPWLFPLGFHSPSFQSLDYFPLIPWYGLFLQGVSLGALLRNSRFFSSYRPLARVQFLEKIGRNGLLIYMVHQPIIAFIVIFVSKLYN